MFNEQHEDIEISVKNFAFKSYFHDPWNYLDCMHMGLMVFGWTIRLYIVNFGRNFEMPQEFSLLVNPLTTNPARLFLANSTAEYMFLEFCSNLHGIRQNLDLYDAVTSFCGNENYIRSIFPACF
jgi:hypothetical protein